MQTTTLTAADTSGITFGRAFWIRVGFGIPWIVFGVQHYMYADFVATLVPAYMPWRLFWAYATGTAMLAAGLSFVIKWQVKLSAFLLGCLMLLYLLMVHPPLLTNEPQVGQHWTRFMQDIAITGAVFSLAILSEPRRVLAEAILSGGKERAGARVVVRYCYAPPMIVLGAQHFSHNAFVTAKVPAWAPFVNLWDYVIGLTLIAAAFGILFAPVQPGPVQSGSGQLDPVKPGSGQLTPGRTGASSRITRSWTASVLATILTAMALLQYVPLYVTNVHNPGVWTSSMLDLAVAVGGFIIARLCDSSYTPMQISTER